MDRVDCVIAGGGPAGLMLGVLLARAGVKATVLEKHGDFLRDFRGDTIHPSTLTVMEELGWLPDFLNLPHEPVQKLFGTFSGERIQVADLSRLPGPAKFIAMMPQWDFLNFLAQKGAQYPSFNLLMDTEATDLIRDQGTIVGVTARSQRGFEAIKADLVVAADGRGSQLRAKAGLVPVDLGAPMDVMWFRLPREASDTSETQGRFEPGAIFVMLNRGDYWQCAYVIPKGRNEEIRAKGLDQFRAGLAPLLPFSASRAEAITDWSQVQLLTVKVDRLEEWARPGLLFIGDAAHAMSPLGGVGVNLAIQDAVAAANILMAPLRNRTLSMGDLKAVQKRRSFPVRMTQRMQLGLQNTIIAGALRSNRPLRPPLALRLIVATPWLRDVPGRLVGLGFQPEHISSEIRQAG